MEVLERAVKEVVKKDFEDRLHDIDYSVLSKNYVPTKFALKFIAFIKLVNGSLGEENTSPLFHYDMLDTLMETRQNLFVCFRGGAKTSVIHEYMFLYIAVYGEVDGFGEVDVAVYVADTNRQWHQIMCVRISNPDVSIRYFYRNTYLGLNLLMFAGSSKTPMANCSVSGALVQVLVFVVSRNTENVLPGWD